MDKVSVIIPTFNRFKYLLNAIKSIKEQTYTNIEIIVVNDCSTEEEYYTYDWKENSINIIHLKENSKKTFGFPCAGGYQRNFGIEIANGKYIAFCDDDDLWFPKKIEMQINSMKESGCKMSSTDGLFGSRIYDSSKKYKRYNAETYYNTLQNIFKKKESKLLENGFPTIWNLDFLKIHNCVICSSVIIEKDIIDKVGKFSIRGTGNEDYDYWIRTLKYTDLFYVNDIGVYYDHTHANGRNWGTIPPAPTPHKN
jgi:glycosyltransferase involved in cell wall biosynthesis